MVPEAVAVVAGFQNLAAMREPIEQRRGHLGVAKDGLPFGEAEVGGDGQTGVLVELADQVELRSKREMPVRSDGRASIRIRSIPSPITARTLQTGAFGGRVHRSCAQKMGTDGHRMGTERTRRK